MSYATLVKDIVAHEDGDESTTKMFEVGYLLDVEDWDDDWFSFYDSDGDLVYMCDERPDDVLTFDDAEHNNPEVPIEKYRPVPNMTPLSRKHLLL